MKRFSLNRQYVIEVDGDLYRWREFVDIDDGVMVFEGNCRLDSNHSILFLSPWEEIWYG